MNYIRSIRGAGTWVPALLVVISSSASGQLKSPFQDLGARFQVSCKHTKKVFIDDEALAAARKTAGEGNIFDEYTGFSESLYFSRNLEFYSCRIRRTEDRTSVRSKIFESTKLQDEFLTIRTPGLSYVARLVVARNKDYSKTKQLSNIDVVPRLKLTYFENFPPIACTIGGETTFDPSMHDMDEFFKGATAQQKLIIGNFDASWKPFGIPTPGLQTVLNLSPKPGFVGKNVRGNIFSPEFAVGDFPSRPRILFEYKDWHETPCGFFPQTIIISHYKFDGDGLGLKELASKETYSEIRFSKDAGSATEESISPFVMDDMILRTPASPNYIKSKKEAWTYGDPMTGQKSIGTEKWVKIGFAGAGFALLAPIIKLLKPKSSKS